MHNEIGVDKKLRHRFEKGRMHHPLEPVVEISTTIGSVYDSTMEIATV
jgi:hypothetical protein